MDLCAEAVRSKGAEHGAVLLKLPSPRTMKAHRRLFGRRGPFGHFAFEVRPGLGVYRFNAAEVLAYLNKAVP